MEIKNKNSGEAGKSTVVYLRLAEVKRRVGLSRSEIYRLIRARRFPAQVKLSTRASAWVEEEIQAWCESKRSAREAL